MGVNFSRPNGTEPTTSVHCSADDDGRSAQQEISDKMEKQSEENGGEEEFFETQDESTQNSHEQEMIEFKKELAIKREQRRKIIAKHTSEKENLRNSLELQIKANQTIHDENKVLRELLQQHNITVPHTSTSNNEVSELQGPVAVLFDDLERFKSQNKKLRLDLTETNVSLQSANANIANMQSQNIEAMKQINALKEVVAVTKTMMKIRESQLIELKAKLTEIESSLADREANLLSTDLRAEYERQLQNIRTLRTLYDERARLAEVTRLQLTRDLEDQKALAAVEATKCQELASKVEELEAKISDMSDTLDNKDDQISVSKEETRGLKAEMSTVNKLFSQMLLGYRSQQDLDKLVSRLEEHHGLLSHLVAREGSESSSALPKLLLDLLSQVESPQGKEQGEKKEEENSMNTTAEEIVGNLPKVWRVLMELLSHQSGAMDDPAAATPSTCYKAVDTPTGTRMVPSVSQTYIRLKDLIVEKLSLTKEMTKMKQLNSHLETRLEQQERRLCLVTSELSKTWHVVGRLRRHHHQLHTHEKILRYELQQKRKMLNELKEELEFCREKWDKAKEKNTESEKEWRKLRTEFSARKNKASSINNSGESGYSDERQTEDDSTESNDESECDPPLRCKMRTKKNTEVLHDSSTDANPAAEREDPISDMLDVADLPLDGLDVEEHIDKTCDSLKDDDDQLSVSDSCASEIFAKSQCSMASEVSGQSSRIFLAIEEPSENDPKIQDSSGDIEGTSSNHFEPTTSSLKPASFKSDVIMETLEENSSIVINQATKSVEFNENYNGTLTNEVNTLKNADKSMKNDSKTVIDDNINSMAKRESFVPQQVPESQSGMSTDNKIDNQSNPTTSQTFIAPSEILENIKIQNERLAQRDERMKRLEEDCSSLLNTSKSTLQVGAALGQRLDDLHSIWKSSDNSQSEINENATTDAVVPTESTASINVECASVNDNKVEENTDEASTSTGTIDHEARFAARDERLKRLEEQAKSLVDKVNDTATKSVKITYKLEELHNIYGSEGGTSRNQTPSDDEAEESQDNVKE